MPRQLEDAASLAASAASPLNSRDALPSRTSGRLAPSGHGATPPTASWRDGGGGNRTRRAAGGDSAVRGSEGQPDRAAGGGERGRARPALVRGAGRTPGTWSTGSRGYAARV